MNAKKLLVGSLAVSAGLVLTRQLWAPTRLASPAGHGGPYDAIDAFIEQQRRRLNIPGVALALVEGDQIVHARGFGQARPGGPAPSPQTPFFIGSLTKSFTAVAVLQLVEAGQVDLDAPVQRYLPWFRVAQTQASTQMTVRHLLNQTSGLPQLAGIRPLADFDDSAGASERQARSLATLRLTRPVGSAWEYCNMNYNLLGLIIEAASGEAYATYVQDHILAPLAMGHTYTAQAEAKAHGLAMGHQYWFGLPIAVPTLPSPQGSLASGQLIASAEDLAHYLIAHLNEGCLGEAQILSGAGIAELHRPAVEAKTMGQSWGQYGMGWFVQKMGETTIHSHSGTVPDFFAYMALQVEQKKGVVLLVNANHLMMNAALAEVGTGVTARLAGLQPAPLRLGMLPWALRALLLIPLLQIVGAAAPRWLRRWRQNPAPRPSRGRQGRPQTLLPLIPNLAFAAIPVYWLVNKMLGFMWLFLPDLTAISLISGGLAGIWAGRRTRLILRALDPHP